MTVVDFVLSRTRHPNPGSFALVMATGIVSISIDVNQHGMHALALMAARFHAYMEEPARASLMAEIASATGLLRSPTMWNTPATGFPMPPLRVKRYLLTGLLTFIPLWVTWLVFKFVLGLLAGIGAPLVAGLLGTLALVAPNTAESLKMEWLVFIVALVITLVALYLLGFVANRMIGQRFLNAFDALLARIPLVQTIYGGTKKLMAVLQNKPSGVQRVVLVDFPRRGMKVVGFVTRVMIEEGSGREMAAVYIPTTPNPTGGYLEVVPLDELTPTDWTMDQAMAFIISGGAVAPDTLPASPRLHVPG